MSGVPLVENASLLPEDTSTSELAQTGLDWLSSREDRPEWSHVWETRPKNASLLPQDTSTSELTQTGLNWLPSREDRPEWSMSLGNATQKCQPAPSKTLPPLNWLKPVSTGSHLAKTARMVACLANSSQNISQNPEILQLGSRWLTTHEDRPDWAHVWGDLIKPENSQTK